MAAFRHDGTAEGMLTAIGRALAADPEARVVPPDSTPSLLADDAEPVAADAAAADALLARIGRDLGDEWVRRVLRLLLSEEAGVDAVVCRLLALAFRHGGTVTAFHADPDIRRAAIIERDVGGETHRLKGLLRFRLLANGRLWGPVEPRHNVITLIAPHFRRRMGESRWVIHDVGRGFGIAYDPGRPLCLWHAAALEAELAAGMDPSEADSQNLWRAYFDSIAIRSRTNARLQRQNMPARYWRHLVEVPAKR